MRIIQIQIQEANAHTVNISPPKPIMPAYSLGYPLFSHTCIALISHCFQAVVVVHLPQLLHLGL